MDHMAPVQLFLQGLVRTLIRFAILVSTYVLCECYAILN